MVRLDECQDEPGLFSVCGASVVRRNTYGRNQAGLAEGGARRCATEFEVLRLSAMPNRSGLH
jgi:hypothetical protein